MHMAPTPSPSRRTLLKTVAGGLGVIGLSAPAAAYGYPIRIITTERLFHNTTYWNRSAAIDRLESRLEQHLDRPVTRASTIITNDDIAATDNVGWEHVLDDAVQNTYGDDFIDQTIRAFVVVDYVPESDAGPTDPIVAAEQSNPAATGVVPVNYRFEATGELDEVAQEIDVPDLDELPFLGGLFDGPDYRPDTLSYWALVGLAPMIDDDVEQSWANAYGSIPYGPESRGAV